MDMDVVVAWIGSICLAAIVVGLPVSCSVHNSNLKAEAIRGGADPIAADCAFGAGDGSSVRCVLAAVRLQGSKEKP